MSYPSTNSFWERLNNLALVRFLLLFASGWAIVQVLSYFATVIVIFTCATLLAFILSYPVRWLKRFLPHGWAVSVVFLTSVVFMAAIAATVGLVILSQGQLLAESVAEFFNSLSPILEQFETFLRNRNLQIDFQVVEERLREQALAGITSGLSLLQIILANLLNLLFIAVIAFFMLMDGKRLWNLVLKLVPVHLRDRLTVTIQRNLLGFFWGQFLLCLFFIASAFIIFLALRVPFALVLAVIVGVFDLIPGIGATLGICLVCLILLSQSAWLSLKVLVACILLQQVQENLLLPRIMQNSLDINPVLMFFALLVGARVAGLLGIFLAIPVTGVLVSFLEIEEMKGRSHIDLKDKSPTSPL
jgi:predicted PurR-regulated permease PerM